MGLTTPIEWTDSTCNPAMGCDGCELWPSDHAPKEKKRCYAGKLVQFHGASGNSGWPAEFGKPQLFPGRIEKALKWKDLTGTNREDKPWLNGYPRLIFLGDLGDNFTESLPNDWMAPYVPAMAASPHIWITLTKRPARMRDFWQRWCCGGLNSDHLGRYRSIPPNFWLLTSVTGPENVNRVRELLKLRALGAKVLGASYEPAWGFVDWARFCTHPDDYGGDEEVYEGIGYLDWLISGGESGADAKPSHPDWFREARDACQASAITSYFHKQNGEWTPEGGSRPGLESIRLTVAGRDGSDLANAADGGDVWLHRVGKKAAGALLDGREWREMPQVAR